MARYSPLIACVGPAVAAVLRDKDHAMSEDMVARMLTERDTLQANHKVEGTKEHLDQDTPCQWIVYQAAVFQAASEPVISVDAKQKKLVGAFKIVGVNGRKETFRRGQCQ